MLANIIIMASDPRILCIRDLQKCKEFQRRQTYGMQPDAAEIVEAVADAAGLLLRELHSLLAKRII